MLEQIFEILKNPKAQRNILAVALVAAILFFRGCGTDDTIDTYKYETNIAALKDSIRTYETRNGDLVYEKMALITERDELKKYNKDLADEVKDLKDNPIVVTKFETKIVHDTVWIQPEIDTTGITWNSDSTILTVPFDWSDSTYHDDNNYKIIGGKYFVQVDTAMNVSSDKFVILVDEIGLSFKTGITENDEGQPEIFIESKYPGFKPTAIDGALFDPRESEIIKKFFPPKKWGLSVYGGVGGYVDPWAGRVGPSIQVGIGVSWDLIQWHGKKK